MPPVNEVIIPNNALYYPFINVPNSQEFLQVLLYWDKVYSIVPMQQLERSFLFPHMNGYVEAGLVAQLNPAEFVYQLPGEQYNDFFELMRSERRRIERNRNNSDHEPVLIHVEKLDQYADEFVRLGLARRSDGPWYEMPRWLAMRFMSFLAVAFGRLEGVRAAPVTDQIDCYRMFGGSRLRNQPLGGRPANEILFTNLLPVPSTEVNPQQLMRFKNDHVQQLNQFRRRIELEAIQAHQIADADDRNRFIQLKTQEMLAERNDLAEQMRQPFRISFCSLAALFGGAVALATLDIPGLIGGGAAIAGGVAQARGERQAIAQNPLTYAASAYRRFSVVCPPGAG